MHSRRQLIIYFLLIFCFITEALCSTYLVKPVGDILALSGQNTFFSFNNNNFVSIFYLLGGIGVALLALIPVNKTPATINTKGRLVTIFIVAAITIGLFIIGIYTMANLVSKYPIIKEEADMLPIMRVLNERLLSHQKVYAPIPSIWNESPVYMPAMWLPFMLAIIAHFDMRWITLCLLYAGVLIIIFSVPYKVWQWNLLPFFLPLFALLYFLLYKDPHLIRNTEEPIVIFYYLLLALSIINGNAIFMAVCFTLCGLSRYSFLGWALFCIPFIFLKVSKWKAVKIFGYTITFSLLLLIISGAMGNLWFFINTRQYYLADFYNPVQAHKYKMLALSGVGLAKFFPFHTLTVLLHIQYGLTLLFPVIAFVIYKRFKTVETNWLLLCLLKLDLVLFYNCMVMPWSYLFFTSTFLSAFIVIQYAVREFKNSDGALTLQPNVLK